MLSDMIEVARRKNRVTSREFMAADDFDDYCDSDEM
jgi:hypothetical protein